MSQFREDTLRTLQEDLRWPLLADEYFSDVGVVQYQTAELEHEIRRMLTPVSEINAKCGVGVVVMPLRAGDRLLDASSKHPLTVRATYLVLEVPEINKGPGGVGKPALSVCSRIRHVLKHYILGGIASPLVPDGENHIVPVDDPICPVAYEVNFNCFDHVDQNFFKVTAPVFDYDDVQGLLSIACGTPDVTIYYTLDGSYPYTSSANPNPAAVVYTGPITIEGEPLVRAAAFKESYLPSNVVAARMNLIGDQSGSGAAMGEEGGGGLQQS
jgi:hypothetical protein